MLSRETLFQAIIAVGGLLLAFSTLSKRWFYAEWVKTAFWVAFFAAMLDVVLAFIVTHFAFSDAIFWRIRTGKSICVGIGVGMLLLFFLSGEAIRGYHRWREQRRASHASDSRPTRPNQTLERTAAPVCVRISDDQNTLSSSHARSRRRSLISVSLGRFSR